MSPAVDYSRLARYYDSLVTDQADVPFFLEESRRARGRVVELMCGTGRVSMALAAAGIDLTCVDSSAEMLQELRLKLAATGHRAVVEEQDVSQLQLPGGFQLAFIAFNSFEELISRKDQLRALAGIRRILAAEGRFLCTLHNPTTSLRSISTGPQVSATAQLDGRQISLEIDVRHDTATGIVQGTECLIIRATTGEVISSETLPLRYRLIEELDFRRLVETAGLSVVEVFGAYDRSAFDRETSPFMIWCLAA